MNKIKEFAKGRWLEVHLLYIYFRVESPDNSKIPPLRLDAWDKRSDLVHWEDLEGAGREGGGRGNRDGEHM